MPAGGFDSTQILQKQNFCIAVTKNWQKPIFVRSDDSDEYRTPSEVNPDKLRFVGS